MKPSTCEWVRAAEEDFDVANSLLRRKPSAANVIGFHCHQTAERYLKAQLEELSLSAAKARSLTALLKPLLPHHPTWATLKAELRLLNNCGLESCYPGHTATRVDVQSALAASRSIRTEIRSSLGLPKK